MSTTSETSYEPRIRLPHTSLVASRIGLGSSFGISADDVEMAYDQGINYFYWGSVRRPGFGSGIRRLAKRGNRENIVVTLQSYARWPAALLRTNVESGLLRLQLDYADILLLGWYNSRPPKGIIDAALELKHKGRVNHLMMSGHKRAFFPEMAREQLFDLFMVRYNAAHRGAEEDVFPKLPTGEGKPAICAYTATRWGSLVDAKKTPEGERTPTAGDCYRFCLSNPDVDMTLSGPATTEHVREACDAHAKGPLEAEELEWMRRVGDHVYGRSPVTRLAD